MPQLKEQLCRMHGWAGGSVVTVWQFSMLLKPVIIERDRESACSLGLTKHIYEA